jgi:membrane protease YdiL (CAAX protease family)
MQLLNSPRLNFYFGCFAEAALLGVAAILAFAFNYQISQNLFWRLLDVVWGLAATVPMLLGYGWLLRSSTNFAAGMRRFFEHVIRPIFGPWSILQLAVISLLAGVCEEALFRGVLQGGLTPLTGAPAALVIASVAFGLAHPISRHYVLAATAIGFFLGGLFIATDNLLAPIVTHAVYDFCVLAWFLRLHRSDPR